MSKLKGINWKEFILGHGEKFVLGGVVVFVLASVGSARWSTYSTPPGTFETKVETEKGKFNQSKFPAEKRAEYDAPDPGDEVDRVLNDEVPKTEYSTVWVSPLNKKKEKLKEPAYDAVVEVVADAGKVLLQLNPEQPAQTPGAGLVVKVDDGSAPGDASTQPGAVPGVTGPRVDGPRVAGPRNAGPSAAGPGAAASTPFGPGYGEDPGFEGNESSPGGEGYPGGGYPGAGGYPGGGYPGGGGIASNLEARGARFVAVRGVFPHKSQVQKYMKALNAETLHEAAQSVQFWDFELQRKAAIPGAADPWASEWEPVDIEVAVNLLGRTDFDVDVVSDEYRDAVFTMPLPYRVTGSWDTAVGPDGRRILASHPRIKRLLTEKEKDEQEARAAALIQAAQDAEAMKDDVPGGFGGVQHNTRSLQSAMGSSSSMRESYNDLYSSMMGGGEPGGSEPGAGYSPYGAGGAAAGRGAYGRMNVVATPDLLLFRFFDFSVVPGNAYVYRVRLKLTNPNYDRDIAELDDPAFREGKFRLTPWSEMSNPAGVRDETEMFLAKVDERRGVDLDVYQWMTETGTYVKGPFEKLQRGDRVAAIGVEDSRGRKSGQLETDVLRPVNMTYATEEIDYVTSNTLVDFRKIVPLSPESHPDLQLSGRRLKLSYDEALTLNQFGELVLLDSVTQSARYNAVEARQKQQEELWGHLKNAGGAASGYPGGGGGIEELLGGESGYGSEEGYDGAEGGYPGMGGGYPGMGGSSGKGGRRRRSSLKRGGAGGAYGGYGSGYPGM